MEETVMEEQKGKELKGNKEYKKFKKLLKKAYKASVKENQLEAFVKEAKKNFPGYMKAQKAYDEAPRGADVIKEAAFERVEADFYEAYAEQIDKYRKTRQKAFELRCRLSGKLTHADEKESEEE